MSRRLLIALGGNAIKKSDEKGTTEEQIKNVRMTCKQIAKLLQRFDDDDRITITHGNGPQVGNLLIQHETTSHKVPPQAFDVIGAMSQGQIGYMFQQNLQNQLSNLCDRLAKIKVVSIVNQVLVSADDPEFLDPTKPIGNFFTKNEAEKLSEEEGYVINPPPGKEYLEKKRTGFVIKQVKPNEATLKPFRRVVPSPDPIANVEGTIIKMLVDQGIIVIASGGGGIPVVKNKEKGLEGLFAVIDKDKAGEILAEAIEATDFLIITDVNYAKLDFSKPNERPIKKISIEELEKYHAEGHFLAGSMGPKIEACIKFIKWGGKRAIITSIDNVVDAFDGKTGTQIYK